MTNRMESIWVKKCIIDLFFFVIEKGKKRDRARNNTGICGACIVIKIYSECYSDPTTGPDLPAFLQIVCSSCC